jgi:outer membrane receptor for ferrienterochelin and colicins
MKTAFLRAIALFSLGILLSADLSAQTLTGLVEDASGDPAPLMRLGWLGAAPAALTDSAGRFVLPRDSAAQQWLLVAPEGYPPDTVDVGDLTDVVITLGIELALEEIRVRARQPGIFLSALRPWETEIITQRELRKGACCDLAGCFETQGSVQSVTTNVVTQSKELRVLGLAGVYTQVLLDGFPLLQGLSFLYGISAVPGPLIDKIYVSKGANSVVQGPESISGQINVEYKEPEEAEPWFAQVFANHFGETQINGIAAQRSRDGQWGNVAAVHAYTPTPRKIDRDGDGFLDIPHLSRIHLYDKIKFRDDDSLGLSLRVGLRWVGEQRLGGQVSADFARDTGSAQHYVQSVRYHQPEAYTKAAFRFDVNRRIVLMAAGQYHAQDAWYGTLQYVGRQGQANVSLQYEQQWGPGHDLKVGMAFRWLRLDEGLRFSENVLNRTFAGTYLREEKTPGFFAENVFRWDKLTAIAAFRVDAFSQRQLLPSLPSDLIRRWMAAPRGLLKYDFSEQTDVRVMAGLGWRAVNIFPENVGLLASSREVRFEEALRPERALNLGGNFNHRFRFSAGAELALGLDVFHTRFFNQIFPDYNTDPRLALLRNFEGKSFSNGLQVDIRASWGGAWEIKAAYNWLEVYRMVGEQRQDLPFNPAHKLLLTGSWHPKKGDWRFDTGLQLYGPQQLPATDRYPFEFRRPDRSRPFVLWNLQATKVWKHLEIYAGAENVLDFRQLQPIVSWQNPFGPYFDTGFNWGPTRGREFYVGIRTKWGATEK